MDWLGAVFGFNFSEYEHQTKGVNCPPTGGGWHVFVAAMVVGKGEIDGVGRVLSHILISGDLISFF